MAISFSYKFAALEESHQTLPPDTHIQPSDSPCRGDRRGCTGHLAPRRQDRPMQPRVLSWSLAQPVLVLTSRLEEQLG